MKTILCYGDSNVWGNIPGTFDAQTNLSHRYTKDKRWTGILQKELGENYNVVEEGINSRTTTLDEIVPGRPYKNGLTQLPVCLETHYPIDLIILWLGTNDTKIQYNCSAQAIAEGMRKLISVVKSSNKGPRGLAPKILIAAPQPLIKVSNLPVQLDDSAIEKSKKLASVYKELAKEEGCEFFDASLVVNSSEVDGVHLDEPECKALGEVMAEKVRKIFM